MEHLSHLKTSEDISSTRSASGIYPGKNSGLYCRFCYFHINISGYCVTALFFQFPFT